MLRFLDAYLFDEQAFTRLNFCYILCMVNKYIKINILEFNCSSVFTAVILEHIKAYCCVFLQHW